jgi:hypothetical protein
LNSSACHQGNCIATAFSESLSFILFKDISKSAHILSILFKKHILGTLYLVACFQTVSDCGSTQAAPSNTATQPSNTLRDLSTSIVKSTCQGVSITLT